jgi:Fe-S cluster biogenesis protein NfuA
MRRAIQKLIDEEINPAISNHGGVVELLDVVDSKVYIRFAGGCQGCSMVSVTLIRGVTRVITERFPSIIDVIDQTNHDNGTNPFFE